MKKRNIVLVLVVVLVVGCFRPSHAAIRTNYPGGAVLIITDSATSNTTVVVPGSSSITIGGTNVLIAIPSFVITNNMPSSITSPMITDLGVSNVDLSANSVTSAKIADGTIILGTDTLTDAGALINLPIQGLRITNSFSAGYTLTSTDGTNLYWAIGGYTNINQFMPAVALATNFVFGYIASNAPTYTTLPIGTNVIANSVRTSLADRFLHIFNAYSSSNVTISSRKLLNAGYIIRAVAPITQTYDSTTNTSVHGAWLYGFDGTSAFDASGAINLNASSIASGTVPDARLSANVVTNNRPAIQTQRLLLFSNSWLQADASGTNLLFIANNITNQVNSTILP